jgi:hypothetical protein
MQNQLTVLLLKYANQLTAQFMKYADPNRKVYRMKYAEHSQNLTERYVETAKCIL